MIQNNLKFTEWFNKDCYRNFCIGPCRTDDCRTAGWHELIHCASSNPLCVIKSNCNLIVLKTIYCKGDLAWTVSAQLMDKETLEVLQLRRQHWPKSRWNTAHCTPALPPCTGHQGNGPLGEPQSCGRQKVWKHTGLHSGDGKPTVRGQRNMKEVLREQKVQPTTGLKAINFLMEDMQWQGHSREEQLRNPVRRCWKRNLKTKRGKAAQPIERWQHGEMTAPTAAGNMAHWNKGQIATRGAEYGEEEKKINWSTFPPLCFNFLDLSIRKTRTSHTWIFWKKLKTVGWTYVTGSDNLTQVSCSLTNSKIPLLKKKKHV